MREQWNEPDRHDHYLMQLTGVMANTSANLKIKFIDAVPENAPPLFPKPMTKKQIAEIERRERLEAIQAAKAKPHR